MALFSVVVVAFIAFRPLKHLSFSPPGIKLHAGNMEVSKAWFCPPGAVSLVGEGKVCLVFFTAKTALFVAVSTSQYVLTPEEELSH